MLVTPHSNRRNQAWAAGLAAMTLIAAVAIGLFNLWYLFGIALAPVVYWWTRRKTIRRQHIMTQPFPQVWEGVLHSNVAYFTALDAPKQERFRQLVKIFLDETRITGIRTDADETTRVLVAASAIIPVFNFDDWEYTRLGEVLIYPDSFDDSYRSDGDAPRNTLGMVGTGHLSGVMILSKPSLIAGFRRAADKDNVGIHEFAHLVDGADGAIDGVPPGVPADIARLWVEWVAQELADPPGGNSHIRDYAYTNEAEYFAVLVEYFFEAPEALQAKNPELYQMMSKMFRQDTAKFLPRATRRRTHRIRRNSRCPCGSGKKFKKCCLRNARRGVPRA